MISDQITALTADRTDIANAITQKGGTVNTGDGFDNFAADILTIPSGITPEGTTGIFQNISGKWDISEFRVLEFQIENADYTAF